MASGGSYFYSCTPISPIRATRCHVASRIRRELAAIVASDNVVDDQFHPEKSADLGLRLYANFGRSPRVAVFTPIPAY